MLNFIIVDGYTEGGEIHLLGNGLDYICQSKEGIGGFAFDGKYRGTQNIGVYIMNPSELIQHLVAIGLITFGSCQPGCNPEKKSS